MIVRINVYIQSEASEQQHGSYGSIQFNEEAQLQDSSFEMISKVFNRCHELLETLKAQATVRRS